MRNSYPWIWYIGIALDAARSIPRWLMIGCTHFRERPIPVQVSLGFDGLRNLAASSGAASHRLPRSLLD